MENTDDTIVFVAPVYGHTLAELQECDAFIRQGERSIRPIKKREEIPPQVFDEEYLACWVAYVFDWQELRGLLRGIPATLVFVEQGREQPFELTLPGDQGDDLEREKTRPTPNPL